MRLTGRCISLSAGAFLIGVASLGAQQTRYATSDTRIRISKGEPTFTRGYTTRIDVNGRDTTIMFPVPARAFRLDDYLNLTEANITAYIASRDSLEIAFARLAQQKVVEPAVRDFAAMIERDRTWQLDKAQKSIQRDGADPLANDYAAQRIREVYVHLDGMPSGKEWDAAFLRFQFFQHENDVAVMRANKQNARNDKLEDLIEDSIPMLEKGRETARTLANALGVSLP